MSVVGSNVYLHLLNDDALSVGRTAEGVSPLGGKMSLVVSLICPALETPGGLQLASCVNTSGSTHFLVNDRLINGKECDYAYYYLIKTPLWEKMHFSIKTLAPITEK